MALRQVPGPVLRNRGVPVSVHRLATDQDGTLLRPLTRVFDNADEPVFDERYVQLTNLALSDIEERFGSLDAWQEALATTPFKSTVDTLALIWEMDRRVVGAMLVDGALDDYSTALGASFMMANGSTPDDVGKVLRQGVKAAKEVREEMSKAIDELVSEALSDTSPAESSPTPSPTTEPLLGTPGPSTSEPGSELVGASTSSGD